MKLDYFSTLEAVVRTGSLSAASKECHITPSAVSMQMKQLETYFGSPLFDRSGPQLRPTALAREVISRLQPALEGVEGMRRRDQSAVEGELILGVIDSLQPSLMPRIFTVARARYPALDLHIQRGRTAHLTSELKAGNLHAAIVAQPEEESLQRLAWTPLFRAPLVVIAPPHSVETDIHELFERYPWVRFDRDSANGRMATQFVRSCELRTQNEIELQSIPAIFGMVNAGLGVSLLAVPDTRLGLSYPVRTLGLGRQSPFLQFSLAMRPADAERRLHSALRLVCEEVTSSHEGVPAETLVTVPRRGGDASRRVLPRPVQPRSSS